MVRKCVSWVCQNQWFQVPFLLLPFASVHLERGPNSSVELKRMRPRKKKRKAKRRNICFCAKLHDSPAHFSGTESRIISARELSLQTQPLHDQNTKRDPIMAVKYMPSRKRGSRKNAQPCKSRKRCEALVSLLPSKPFSLCKSNFDGFQAQKPKRPRFFSRGLGFIHILICKR